MKKLLLLVSLLFISCQEAGVTSQSLSGSEQTLPDELKGLKVYNVSIGSGGYVKVAVLNNGINSTTYKSGKTHKSIITVYSNTTQEFQKEDIISENDSIIVLRKNYEK